MERERKSRTGLPLLPLVPLAHMRQEVRPLYRRTVEWLAASLCRVQDPTQYRLPGDRELVALSGLSLVTVKHALAELADLGFLERRHGSGTYPVRRPSVDDLLRIVQPSRFGFYSFTRLHMLAVLRYDLLYFLQKSLAAAGTHLMLFTAEDVPDGPAQREFDGVFVAGNPGAAAVRRVPGLPLVFIGSAPHRAKCDSVSVDLANTGARAAEQFQDLGARKIGFFGAAGPERSVGRHIVRSLRAHLGLERSVDEFCGDVEATYHAALDWFRHGSPPFFVLTGFALSTGALIRAAEAAGLRIGRDVHLVCYGAYNLVLEDLAPMRILCTPRRRMAETALELMLLRLIAPCEPHRHVALTVEVL